MFSKAYQGRLHALLGAGVIGLASLSVAQKTNDSSNGVKFLGVGPSVQAKSLDTKSFAKQIDPGKAPYRKEMDHDEIDIPFGRANSLVAGGINNLIGITKLGTAFPAVGNTGAEPPDPDIAVGPTHIINVVNSDIAFFTKAGSKVFQQSFQNFFRSVTPEAFDFDPKVIYDQQAGKFIVLQLGLNDASTNGTSSLLIGVSDTPDPTKTWKLFKVDVKQTEGSNNFWLDYPGLGVNKDTIAISGNMFAMTGSSGYNGVQIIAFPKDTLYAGTATPSKFKVAGGTAQFGKAYDAAAPAVYAVQSSTQTSVTVTAVQRNGTAFTVTQRDIPVPQWSPIGAAQGVNGRLFDSVGPRVFSVAQRGDRLVSSHTVAGPNRRHAARWYDIKLNNWPAGALQPALSQSGTIEAPSGNAYVFPSISIDSRGGLGLAMCNLSASTTGQILVCGRRLNDPVGTMSAPAILESAPGTTYTGFSNRWGDYLDTEIDPSDNTTFWTVGMGAGTNGKWLTLINKFRVSPDPSDFTTLAPLSATIQSGSLQSGTFGLMTAVDGQRYALNSQLISGLGQSAGFASRFKAPSRSVISLMRVLVNLDAAKGATVLVLAQNPATMAWEQIDTVTLVGSSASRVIDFNQANIARFVAADGTINLATRALISSRNARPSQFVFGTDQFVVQYIPAN
jgi:hypothetical protein